MIREWQPILPGDKRKLDKRKLYEFLREDTTTFIIVGIGEEASLDAIDDVVAWREYEDPAIARRAAANPPTKAGK